MTIDEQIQQKELEKLKLEVKQLSRPFWTQPAFITSFLTFGIAAWSVYQAEQSDFFSNQETLHQIKKSEIKVEENRLISERDDLKKLRDQLAKQTDSLTNTKKTLEEERDILNKQKALLNEQNKLLNEEKELIKSQSQELEDLKNSIKNEVNTLEKNLIELDGELRAASVRVPLNSLMTDGADLWPLNDLFDVLIEEVKKGNSPQPILDAIDKTDNVLLRLNLYRVVALGTGEETYIDDIFDDFLREEALSMNQTYLWSVLQYGWSDEAAKKIATEVVLQVAEFNTQIYQDNLASAFEVLTRLDLSPAEKAQIIKQNKCPVIVQRAIGLAEDASKPYYSRGDALEFLLAVMPELGVHLSAIILSDTASASDLRSNIGFNLGINPMRMEGILETAGYSPLPRLPDDADQWAGWLQVNDLTNKIADNAITEACQ